MGACFGQNGRNEVAAHIQIFKRCAAASPTPALTVCILRSMDMPHCGPPAGRRAGV